MRLGAGFAVTRYRGARHDGQPANSSAVRS
jgi:hypothetical protein